MRMMMRLWALAPVVFVGMSRAELSGTDSWGGIEAHPCVVNPVGGSEPGRCLSLRGEWAFLRQPMGAPWRNGIWRHFYAEDWEPSHTLQVPGCWEAQGVGEPGMSESWDCKWDDNPKPIRYRYSGDGWYRKTVRIPEAWKGLRIWLKIGGVRSQGWFWVNGKQIAWVDTYCGSYKYEITPFVEAGKEATVVAQVNNVLPARKGLFSAMNRWGGLYRDVEIEATPQAFIDDAWVRGDFDRAIAEPHVTLVIPESERGVKRRLRVTVGDAHVEKDAVAGENVLHLPLKDFKPWSPETPNLYWATIELLEGDRVTQTRRERFGIRKLEVRGSVFYLNNKPFYVRGFGDDFVYPLTGLSPADRAVHLAHLRTARAAGFNFVRLHTHCELPEYFEAADEVGILIQPELPYYSDVPTESFTFDPIRDVTELYRHYRRYPSFGVYSMGNEGTFGAVLDARLHTLVKTMDPDRLKINQDCHIEAINPPESSDYLGGPIKVWPRGSFNPDRPFVTHEYLNLCVKLDSRLEPRYSGAWLPPVTRKQRLEWLRTFGLDQTWGDRLQDAQHGLQRHYQKEGIEAARADPYCDGHIFWTIVDVVVAQGNTYSAQGLFNPFWEGKSNGASAEVFRMFNGPSCVLLDTDPPSRIVTAGETFKADFRLAHFEGEPLVHPEVRWGFSVAGKTVGEARERYAGELICGPARTVLSKSVTVPAVDRPEAARFFVSIGSVSNEWPVWIFPKRDKKDGRALAVATRFRPALEGRYEGLLTEESAANAAVVIAEYGSRLEEKALERGQRVITLSGENGQPNITLGWWSMGKQVGTALADHPALKALPHEGYLSPLLFRMILQTGKALPYAGMDPADMLIVGEGGDRCFLYLAQANMGKGKAMMGFGLNLLADTPEAAALLDGLIDYVRSDAFSPKSRVEPIRPVPQNGWRKTLRAGDSSDRREDLLDGYSRMAVARACSGQTELVWETQPVPATVRERPTFTFTFAGGMGYPQQPPAAFSLSLNGKPVIRIPEIVWKDASWEGEGCVLRYQRDPASDELGIFTLTVPSERLEPGKPALLSATAETKNSRRWFALLER